MGADFQLTNLHEETAPAEEGAEQASLDAHGHNVCS